MSSAAVSLSQDIELLLYLIFSAGQKELYTADLNHDLKLIFSQPLLGLKATSVSCGLEHVVLVSDTGQVYSYGSGR